MDNLCNKLKKLYPALTDDDFWVGGTIQLQNNNDGLGDFIVKWNHPTFSRPTDEQLNNIKEY
jgi:hypothetical protein